jgi:RNA polymerase sigma-70 factor (ECF subfamily)
MATDSKRLNELMTRSQHALLAYLYALLGDPDIAKDVLQETNLYILKNWKPDILDNEFIYWAKSMALFQVRRYRLYRAREKKHLVFDEDVFEAIAATATTEEHTENLNFVALRHCLKRLPKLARACFLAKYLQNKSAREIAAEFGGSEDSILMRLYRTRLDLHACVVKAACALREGKELDS